MVQAANLKTGEAVKVDFGNGRVVDSKIIFIAAVADAASQTRTIRIEIPNKEPKGGGDHVMINFSAAVARARS